MPVRPSDEAIADAPAHNWVDRLAPPITRPFLRLSRADRPIGTWLLLLPCWIGLLLAMLHHGAAEAHEGAHGLWIAIGCALGAVLMRGAEAHLPCLRLVR